MTTIEQVSELLGQSLLKKGWTITTAESCTGGGISTAITEIAGSSAYFERAFITYSNQAKVDLVNVNQVTLDEYGAVSQQTVEEMAIGAAHAANASVAIAVSGIAGPTGGTDLKPVGTVWLAIYCINSQNTDGYTVWSQCYLFNGDRCLIREQATNAALNKALEIVNKKN